MRFGGKTMVGSSIKDTVRKYSSPSIPTWRRADKAESKVAWERGHRGQQENSKTESQAAEEKGPADCQASANFPYFCARAKGRIWVTFCGTGPPSHYSQGAQIWGSVIKKNKKGPSCALSPEPYIIRGNVPLVCPDGMGQCALCSSGTSLPKQWF